MSTKSLDRSPPTTKSAPRCVIFPGALGDFICFLPALCVLSRANPVLLYARGEFADLVPAGVTVRSMECREIGSLFASNLSLESQSFEPFGAFSAVYSWMGSQQPVFVDRLQAATDGRAEIFPFCPAAPGEHQMDYYLRCLGISGAPPRASTVEIGAEARHWRENFWHQNSLQQKAVLTIAPGSGAREKNWPEEFFIAVAEWWRNVIGGVALLLVGPVEMERGGIDRLREHCVTVNELTLAQAAALLSQSTVYLGNDSGISHLAAATGTRTMALFGPSDPLQWAPRGRAVTVVSRPVHCSPCSVPAMKSCSARICLSEISPGDVIAAMCALPELAGLTRGGVGITV